MDTAAQAGPRFFSDEPIKSPYILPLLMTDKPPGKLQSDLENETVEHAAAQLSSLLSFLTEEGKEEEGRGERGNMEEKEGKDETKRPCGCELSKIYISK